jgi:hypothetical protein
MHSTREWDYRDTCSFSSELHHDFQPFIQTSPSQYGTDHTEHNTKKVLFLHISYRFTITAHSHTPKWQVRCNRRIKA